MRLHLRLRILVRLALSLLQVLLVSACVSSSQPPEIVGQNTSQESVRVAKISDLPALGAWRSVQFVNDKDCFFSTPDRLWGSSDSGNTWKLLRHSTDYQDMLVTVQFLDGMFGWIKTQRGWYKSEDGGESWVPFETPLSSSGRLSKVNFINRETGWIGGAALRPATSKELGLGHVPNVPRDLFDDIAEKVLTPIIYRTDDGGKRWRLQNVPASLGNIQDLTFTDSDHGIALSGSGAFQTSNGGKRWVRVNDPRTCAGDREEGAYEGKPSWAYLLDPSFQWLAFDDGRLLRTTNGGTKWVELEPCDQTRPTVVHFSSPSHGRGLGSDRLFYETVDGGKQWIKVGIDKYDSLSFLDRKRVWLLSEQGLFRVKVDQ